MKSSSELGVLFALALGALAGCGKTAPVPAADTHPDVPANVGCVSCHMPEFVATKKPPHEGARPTSCGVCHTQSSWHPARIDHPVYALTGAHLKVAEDRALAGTENQVKCLWCHRGDAATFAGTKTDCNFCHAEDQATATFPGHAAFQVTCQDCHSTDAWKPARHPQAPPPDATAPATPTPAAPTAATPLKKAPTKPPKTVTPKPAPTAPGTSKPPDVISRPSPRR
ncbi:MAG: hypothetical protein ABI551_08285 [Polyangiaceae bacterium]